MTSNIPSSPGCHTFLIVEISFDFSFTIVQSPVSKVVYIEVQDNFISVVIENSLIGQHQI